MSQKSIVVIGAGIGGLTAASLLLKAGCDVRVLEAHVYPGGSAGTFYHKGYRFDAGATLAGGFAPGGPHAGLAETLGLTWPIKPVDPAWVVHLPDKRITQWADADAWRAEQQEKLPGTEAFWRKQEQLAEIAWDVSSRPFPWPPQSLQDWVTLVKAIRRLSCPPFHTYPVRLAVSPPKTTLISALFWMRSCLSRRKRRRTGPTHCMAVPPSICHGAV